MNMVECGSIIVNYCLLRYLEYKLVQVALSGYCADLAPYIHQGSAGDRTVMFTCSRSLPKGTVAQDYCLAICACKGEES